MFIIFFRTIILYLCISAATRLMGKRQLGQLQPAEFAVTMLISNIATLPIEDSDIPLLAGLLPIFLMASLEVLMALGTLKFPRWRKFFSGTPRIVMRDGVIDQKELKNLRLSLDDLMAQLRIQEIFDISEVSCAILETTGNLSIYRKFYARPATAEMMAVPAQPNSNTPPVIVINDGKLDQNALRFCAQTQEWVDRLLRQHNTTVEDVYLLSGDKNGRHTIILKDRI